MGVKVYVYIYLVRYKKTLWQCPYLNINKQWPVGGGGGAQYNRPFWRCVSVTDMGH